MIDIDIIVQNIENKIKSLEQLTFDDEPKNFLYTPIRAVTITSSTDFKQLECQKFVRSAKKNFNVNKKLINRRNSSANQEVENAGAKGSGSRFSRSYTEFLSNLNADMQKFKEQQKKNQDCENFLGKNAKIFVQNENEEQKSQGRPSSDADTEKSTKSAADKLKLSENLKAALKMTKIPSQELKKLELLTQARRHDSKKLPTTLSNMQTLTKSRELPTKIQGSPDENKKFGKIIKNPNPSTVKPKSETRIVGKVMSRRMTIEGGWNIQNSQLKDSKLNAQKSTNDEPKSFIATSGHSTADRVSQQQKETFKMPSSLSNTKQIIQRRMSVELGTKNEIAKNLVHLKLPNSGQKFANSEQNTLNFKEQAGVNLQHAKTTKRKSEDFDGKFSKESESCGQELENSGKKIKIFNIKSESSGHKNDNSYHKTKNDKFGTKIPQVTQKSENFPKTTENSLKQTESHQKSSKIIKENEIVIQKSDNTEQTTAKLVVVNSRLDDIKFDGKNPKFLQKFGNSGQKSKILFSESSGLYKIKFDPNFGKSVAKSDNNLIPEKFKFEESKSNPKIATNSDQKCEKSDCKPVATDISLNAKDLPLNHDNSRQQVDTNRINISDDISTSNQNSSSSNPQSESISEPFVNPENSNPRFGKRKRQMNPKYNESEYMLKNTSREFTNAIRSKLTLNKQQKIPGRKPSARSEQFADFPDEKMTIKKENFDENSLIKMENIKSEPVESNVIDYPSTSQSVPSPQPYNRPVSNEIRCDICSKVFSKPLSLTRHMLLHSEDRRYPCPQCNYRFLQKSDLHRHMVIHDGMLKFACAKCEKKFQTEKSLRRHLHKHDGTLTFKCDKCNVKFRSEKILRYHMMAHHRGRKYECGYCGDNFPLKDFLMSHIKTHVYDEEQTQRFEDDEDGIEEQLYLMENPKIDAGSSSMTMLGE